METQNQIILDHLKNKGSLTPLQALSEYGCMRLGARVFDLRARGVDIRRTIECSVNKNGQKKRYARYWIPKEKAQEA